MPKLTIANQDYESFAEKITTPSIVLTKISSGSELESYYIPLFEGDYSDGSVVQLGDYNYTLGKLKAGNYRAAIYREGAIVYITPAKVFASSVSTWVLTVDGDLYGCGSNEYGQQGSGDTTNVLTFTKRAENVKKFSCSNYTTWYIDNNNDLYGCGWNGYNRYGPQGSGDTEDVLTFTKRAENVKEVRCTERTTWYLTNDDELYGCGYNGYGQQGSGDKNNVLTFTKRAENVKEFRCNDCVTWYLTNDDELYGCGYNGYGQQGNGYSGSDTNVLTFTKRAENVKEFRCSDCTTWYIDTDNNLYGCGYNRYGQQSNGLASHYNGVYRFTKRAENVKKFNCYNYTTWYIDTDNNLYGCGDNNRGQQGSGDKASGDNNNVLTFTKRAENVKEVISFSDGSWTWYIDNNNNLYCSGDDENSLTFTKRAENVKDFCCSGGTNWYIDVDNNLYGCGSNSSGQQGIGNTNSVVYTFTKRDIIK